MARGAQLPGPINGYVDRTAASAWRPAWHFPPHLIPLTQIAWVLWDTHPEIPHPLTYIFAGCSER
jgi:hypothetical protein